VTSYENLNHLLAITDVLITDYSTIIYDCVIAGKPFICFGYDYDEYKDERGFYFDLNDEYPGGVLKTQDEVFARIRELSVADKADIFADFRKKYVQAGGNSTGLILDELYERVK
jgi:CDP-glycerol glycerophosphotransferase